MDWGACSLAVSENCRKLSERLPWAGGGLCPTVSRLRGCRGGVRVRMSLRARSFRSGMIRCGASERERLFFRRSERLTKATSRPVSRREKRFCCFSVSWSRLENAGCSQRCALCSSVAFGKIDKGKIGMCANCRRTEDVTVAPAESENRTVSAGAGCVSALPYIGTADIRTDYSSCRASRFSVTSTLSIRAASISTISKSKSCHESFSPVCGMCFSSSRISPLSVL